MELTRVRKSLEQYGLQRARGNRHQLNALFKRLVLMELIREALPTLEEHFSTDQLLRLSSTCKPLRQALRELSTMHIRSCNPIVHWYQLNHRFHLHAVSPTGEKFSLVLEKPEYLIGRSYETVPNMKLDRRISHLHIIVKSSPRGYGVVIKGRNGAIWDATNEPLKNDTFYSRRGQTLRFPSVGVAWKLTLC